MHFLIAEGTNENYRLYPGAHFIRMVFGPDDNLRTIDSFVSAN